MTTSKVRLDLDYVNFPTVPIIFTLDFFKILKFFIKNEILLHFGIR